MPHFRETRACIASAVSKQLHEQQFDSSVHIGTTNGFDWDEKTNDECKVEVRFYRENIYKHAERLQLPDEI